jgi:PAS domain S-box-containing protein
MSAARETSRTAAELSFRELADNAPVMIWRSGDDALCDWFNKPWLDFTGRTMEQELGNGWAEGVHPDDFDRCLSIYQSAFNARRSFTMTYRLRRADGAYRDILDNGAPFYRDGKFAGYFGSCIDITDQRTLETQLGQAQKMEAIGQLTGGVAHDFNNLLQVISGSLQLLSTDLPDDERVRMRMRQAMEAVDRGAKLASQLLAFARRQALHPEVINVDRLIRKIDDMLRSALGGAVDVEIAVAKGLWNTRVDPVLLETSLLNLAVNARDAMEGRGRLVIEIGNTTLDDAYAGRHVDLSAGQYVAVAVTDFGCGMSSDTIQRAFDPFFTTKAEGRGTGLGLSMVHGFVKQSGGHVTISSEKGRGTTVTLYLPRSHDPESGVAELEPAPATGGAETVLLVEDDDHVRATAADLLTELGYSVLEARDADSALAMIESGATPDVLFTDVVMPGSLQSSDLARRARERLPGIGVVFTSGYSDKATQGNDEQDELLTKPYTREALDRRLRRALDKTGIISPARRS